MTVEELDPAFHAGSESTAKVYIKAAAMLTKDDIATLERLDSLGWQNDPAGAAFLKDKAALSDLVAQASVMPPADFGMNPRDGLGAKIVPILRQYQGFRMLLRLEARELAAGGKADSALKALEVSTRLAHTFAEPVFIYHLVSMLGMDSVFSCAAQIAPKAGVPEFQADVVMAHVGIRAGQWVATEGASKLAVALVRVLMPVRSYAAAGYMERVRRQLDVQPKPWYEGRTKLVALDSSIQGKGFMDRVAGLYTVNMSAFYGRSERATAWRDIAVLGLKALVMKKQTGKLPATLADIASDAPVDRFSGKPYVYKVLPDGFVVYSVGPDGKDDNGSMPDDLAFRVKL
jgi:hypothetical protein